MQGFGVQSLVWEKRPHMPHSTTLKYIYIYSENGPFLCMWEREGGWRDAKHRNISLLRGWVEEKWVKPREERKEDVGRNPEAGRCWNRREDGRWSRTQTREKLEGKKRDRRGSEGVRKRQAGTREYCPPAQRKKDRKAEGRQEGGMCGLLCEVKEALGTQPRKLWWMPMLLQLWAWIKRTILRHIHCTDSPTAPPPPNMAILITR